MKRPRYKELYLAAKAELETMRATEEMLIEDNETVAARLQGYRNSAAVAQAREDNFRKELHALMCKCWATKDPELTEYCDKLEDKYFDWPELYEEDDDIQTETPPEDSGEVPADP